MSWIHILRYGNGHRYSAARAFADSWFGGLEPDDGYSALEIDACETRLEATLPPALRDWYDLIGRRDDLLRKDHIMIAPGDLEWWGERLPFWTSPDAHRLWFIRRDEMNSDDPRVFVMHHDAHGAREVEMPVGVTRFVTQMLLIDVSLAAASHGLSAKLDPSDDIAKDVAHVYRPLPLPEWPVVSRRIFGSEDTLLTWSHSQRLHVGARDRDAFRRVLAFLEGRGYEIEVEWTE